MSLFNAFNAILTKLGIGSKINREYHYQQRQYNARKRKDNFYHFMTSYKIDHWRIYMSKPLHTISLFFELCAFLYIFYWLFCFMILNGVTTILGGLGTILALMIASGIAFLLSGSVLDYSDFFTLYFKYLFHGNKKMITDGNQAKQLRLNLLLVTIVVAITLCILMLIF